VNVIPVEETVPFIIVNTPVPLALLKKKLVEETVLTVSLSVPVAFVKNIPVEDTVLTVSRAVPVAFVKKIPVLLTFVNVPVALWKFPLPVALVNVIPVEETVVPMSVVIVRFVPVAFVKIRPVEDTSPAKKAVPVALTLNCVLEFTWKSMKFPKYEFGLIPRKVPVVDPPCMVFGPSWTREELASSCGDPDTLNAVVPVAESERVVPVALVNVRPAIVPDGVRISVEETMPVRLSVLVLVAKEKVDEPVKTPVSLYCTWPVDPPGDPPVDVEYLSPPRLSRSPRTVVLPSTISVLERLVAPVIASVPAWRFPEPVALVNVIFVEETVSAVNCPEPVAFVNVRPVVEATLVT
jgi:hypothetical protein